MPHPPRMPIRSVLSNLASELDVARNHALRVEEALCALSQQLPAERQSIDELQRIDYVLQHLTALRDFAACISEEDTAGDDVALEPALAKIGLEDVRLRLAGAGAAVGLEGDWEEF